MTIDQSQEVKLTVKHHTMNDIKTWISTWECDLSLPWTAHSPKQTRERMDQA